jgi:hypothetical protein
MSAAVGAGLLAFEKMGAAIPSIAFAALFIGAIWLISACRA